MSNETGIDNKKDYRLIILVRGLMNGGGFYWCYVAVKPELAKEFQKAINNKYNIQNFAKDGYGEVIVSGRGRTPPQEVTDKVAEIYNIPAESLKEDEDTGANIAKILATINRHPDNHP
ncbi:MAG: hypothetical protein R3D71_00975 [Rickettsiales bacterium]